jgi:hypothetical protein
MNAFASPVSSDVPAMPLGMDFADQPHRPRVSVGHASAHVCRQLNRKDIRAEEGAIAALQKELAGLRAAGNWDETGVREWHHVSSESKRSGVKVHIGRIFGIVVEKNTQLKKGDPARKFKGNLVFQGNDTRDEWSHLALFDDVSSSPAAMEAGKAVDAFGLLPGHAVEQADAQQAYIQSDLGGDFVTWVRLPKEFWPESWIKQGFVDPVVPLKRALYGHPRAGHCWEKFSQDVLKSKGFELIKGWRSCFWHPRLKVCPGCATSMTLSYPGRKGHWLKLGG